MGSFTGDYWNLIITFSTVAGLVGMYILVVKFSSRPADEGAEAKETTGHVWDEDLAELNNPLPRWWVNLFVLTLLFAGVYLVLYPGLGSNSMLLGWTQVRQYEEEMAAAEERYGPIFAKYLDQDIPAIAADPEAVRIGARLYATYCTACHGADARGVRGFPNLRDRDWLYGGTPQAIETTIRDGRQGTMPAWKEALGDQGLVEVVQYVLSLSGRATDARAAEAGGARFAQMCAACHGADAKGNPQVGAPNLTDDVWLYGGRPEDIARTVAGGRQGRMPAWGELLGDAKVHLLAAYVYSLSRQ